MANCEGCRKQFNAHNKTKQAMHDAIEEKNKEIQSLRAQVASLQQAKEDAQKPSSIPKEDPMRDYAKGEALAALFAARSQNDKAAMEKAKKARMESTYPKEEELRRLFTPKRQDEKAKMEADLESKDQMIILLETKMFEARQKVEELNREVKSLKYYNRGVSTSEKELAKKLAEAQAELERKDETIKYFEEESLYVQNAGADLCQMQAEAMQTMEAWKEKLQGGEEVSVAAEQELAQMAENEKILEKTNEELKKELAEAKTEMDRIERESKSSEEKIWSLEEMRRIADLEKTNDELTKTLAEADVSWFKEVCELREKLAQAERINGDLRHLLDLTRGNAKSAKIELAQTKKAMEALQGEAENNPINSRDESIQAETKKAMNTNQEMSKECEDNLNSAGESVQRMLQTLAEVKKANKEALKKKDQEISGLHMELGKLYMKTVEKQVEEPEEHLCGVCGEERCHH